MILNKQLIMTIGMTQNNWELTKEMVENSIESFKCAPVVWNKKQEYKNYNGNMDDYKNEKVIGMVLSNDIIIEDNNVYADIVIIDAYADLWKGKFDNWCITLSDDKKSFKLLSIEVF